MSNTSDLKRCPKCDAPIPNEAPQGLCPKCLFLQASIPTDAGTELLKKSPPPELSDLAAAFPQLEILELIGQGGMGFVFKARQPKLDRFVALKILPQSLAADAAFAERFNREGRLLARLSHPNIVTVHDFGVAAGLASGLRPETPQFFYLLMEFVDGVNLRQAMKAGRFTSEQALAVVPKICEALQFAHNEGILHRDIKPENILLDTKGRVKIADFGIAKLVSEASGRAGSPLPADVASQESGAHGVTRPTDELTHAGKTLGTPNYMAPEQIITPNEVDHRADIYSLGVVFYEMLTGELPLGRFAPPSQKSSADPRLDNVVLRALEKEPNRRTQSAGEVKTQVETITDTPVQSAGDKTEIPIRVGESLYATAEFLATTWGAMKLHEDMGTMALYSDRLVLNRGGQSTEIPLQSVTKINLVSYPFWMSPGGLRSILVEFEEAGRPRRLILTPSKGMFSFVGETNRRVAEWFGILRDVTTKAQGKPPGGSTVPELYHGYSSSGKIAVLLAFLSVPILIAGLLIYPILSGAKWQSLISVVPFLLLPIVFGVVITRMRRKQWLRENPLPHTTRKIESSNHTAQGADKVKTSLETIATTEQTRVSPSTEAATHFAGIRVISFSEEVPVLFWPGVIQVWLLVLCYVWMAMQAAMFCALIAENYSSFHLSRPFWRFFPWISLGSTTAITAFALVRLRLNARGKSHLASSIAQPDNRRSMPKWAKNFATLLLILITTDLAISIGKYVVSEPGYIIISWPRYLLLLPACFAIWTKNRSWHRAAIIGSVFDTFVSFVGLGFSLSILFRGEFDHLQFGSGALFLLGIIPSIPAPVTLWALLRKEIRAALNIESNQREQSAGEARQEKPPVPQDRFWRRFAVVAGLILLAMILIPVLAIGLYLGLPALQKIGRSSFQKAPPQTSSTREQIKTSSVTFGPVTTRELSGNEPFSNCFLDLDTGRVLSAPKELFESLRSKEPLHVGGQHWEAIQDWMRSNAVDIVHRTRSKSFVQIEDYDLINESTSLVDGVYSLMTEIKDRQNRPRAFDSISVEDVIHAVAEGEKVTAEGIKLFGGDPDKQSFAVNPKYVSTFRTREGAIGILQMTRFITNEESRVKIHYKLVQNYFKKVSSNQETKNTNAIPSRLQFRRVADEQDVSASDELPDLADKTGERKLRVRREILLDDSAIAGAHLEKSPVNGDEEILVLLTEAGQKAFQRLTKENIGKQLAIIFDGKVLSAPRIAGEIQGRSLQISGKFSAEETEKIIYALNAPRPKSGEPKQDLPGFEPAVELVLRGDKTGNLDLDTGRLLDISKELLWLNSTNQTTRDDTINRWIRQNGIDLLANLSLTRPGVTTIQLHSLATSSHSWTNLSAPLVEQQLGIAGFAGSLSVTGTGEFPATYLFKTDKGNAGILQLLGLSTQPKGVKIRYKLVQNENRQSESSATGNRTNQFQVTLTNGISFEVVGITHRGGSWWKPDGSWCSKEPVEILQMPAWRSNVPKDDPIKPENEFFIYVRQNPDKGITTRSGFYPKPTTVQSGGQVKDPILITNSLNLSHLAFAWMIYYSSPPATIDYRFSVAMDDWEQVAIFDGSKTRELVRGVKIVCEKPFEKPSSHFRFQVMHNLDVKKYALRITAHLKDGKTRPIGLVDNYGSGEGSKELALLIGLNPSEVKEYVIERALWMTGEIKGIALKPNSKN